MYAFVMTNCFDNQLTGKRLFLACYKAMILQSKIFSPKYLYSYLFLTIRKILKFESVENFLVLNAKWSCHYNTHFIPPPTHTHTHTVTLRHVYRKEHLERAIWRGPSTTFTGLGFASTWNRDRECIENPIQNIKLRKCR